MAEYSFQEKIDKSKRVLRLAADISKTYYEKPLIVTYSGGKDSDVMLDLAIKTLKPDDMEVQTSITTVDAPQTNKHINEVFRTLTEKGIQTKKQIPIFKRRGEEEQRPINMWDLIVEKQIPPTRLFRYCCAIFKEASTPNRISALGVRKAESSGRKGRDSFGSRGEKAKDYKFWGLDHAEEVFRESISEAEKRNVDIKEPDPLDCIMIEKAKQNDGLICNPIYEWTTSEIWEYINGEKIKANELYFSPFKFDRVGCVGCPMGGRNSMLKEFSLFPHYKELYIKAFDRMLQRRKEAGKDDAKGGWLSGQDVYFWWIGEGAYNVKGQMTIDEWLKDSNEVTE